MSRWRCPRYVLMVQCYTFQWFWGWTSACFPKAQDLSRNFHFNSDCCNRFLSRTVFWSQVGIHVIFFSRKLNFVLFTSFLQPYSYRENTYWSLLWILFTNLMFDALQEKHHVSNILAKAGVRKGPGNKLAESASSFKSRGVESDTSLVSATEVKLTASGRRLDDSGRLEVVVEGSPTGGSVERHPPTPRGSTRLEPLPTSYTSKHSIRS